MSQNNGSSGVWVIVLAVVGFAMLLNLISGNSGGTTTTTSAPINRSSPEHRYATERFRQEGYSRAESEQAADAVIKFQRAQNK
jgi:hypothetical protein